MKPKHKCHLPQLGDWVYGAQSRKERRLLCEFMFVPIKKQILILKNGRERSVSYETKASTSFFPMSRASLSCPIIKGKEITM